MKTRITHVTLIRRHDLLPDAAIDIENGKILAVHEAPPAPDSAFACFDGGGLYAAPGFIDLHLHGGGGVEFMDATPEEIRRGCAAHARHGTTSLLPTTLAAPDAMTLRMIEAVREAQAITTECSILGVHLEGPFLSPACAAGR